MGDFIIELEFSEIGRYQHQKLCFRFQALDFRLESLNRDVIPYMDGVFNLAGSRLLLHFDGICLPPCCEEEICTTCFMS